MTLSKPKLCPPKLSEHIIVAISLALIQFFPWCLSALPCNFCFSQIPSISDGAFFIFTIHISRIKLLYQKKTPKTKNKPWKCTKSTDLLPVLDFKILCNYRTKVLVEMFTVVCLLGLMFQKLLEELDSSVVWGKMSTAGVFPVSSILDPLQADFHRPHSNKTVITRVTMMTFSWPILSSVPLQPLFVTPLHLVSAFMIPYSNISFLGMLCILSKLWDLHTDNWIQIKEGWGCVSS